jgi:hypothetical protein
VSKKLRDSIKEDLPSFPYGTSTGKQFKETLTPEAEPQGCLSPPVEQTRLAVAGNARQRRSDGGRGGGGDLSGDGLRQQLRRGGRGGGGGGGGGAEAQLSGMKRS